MHLRPLRAQLLELLAQTLRAGPIQDGSFFEALPGDGELSVDDGPRRKREGLARPADELVRRPDLRGRGESVRMSS